MLSKEYGPLIGYWGQLNYWETGEWQVVQEKLDDLQTQKRTFNPSKGNLFKALRLCPLEQTTVCIIGQDPWPSPLLATGVAFSIPETERHYPPTLVNIFKEYQDDLHYPSPGSGDLTKWCEQGVLLWNAYPSVLQGRPGSHHWPEWELLTQEIVEKVDGNAVVFIFLGRQAQSFSKYCSKSKFINTSHPSPLGVKHGFLGSRIFTRTNGLLKELGKGSIDWKL